MFIFAFVSVKMAFRPLTEDYISVVTLPATVVPTSSPSKAVERLLKKRENGHNAAVNFVRLTCQKHNVEVEEEIRQECERLKTILAQVRAEISNQTRGVLKSEDYDSLNIQLFQIVNGSVENCNEDRLKAIDTFYDNVRSLERKRSKCFKTVLREGYKKMEKISHLLPFQLLNYFETETTRLNEITMSNYRYYSKIRADLKLQAQEEMRVFYLELRDAKDKFKTAYKLAKIRGAKDSRKLEDLTNPEVPNISLQNLNFSEEFPRSGMDAELWAQQMKETLNNLETNAKKLISMYKLMVINVFNRLFGELRNVTEALKDDDQVSYDMDFTAEIYKPVIEEITQSYKCDVDTLQNLWNTITGYMESNLQNTNAFLTGCAHLWDAHFQREVDAKSLVLDELKLTIDKNDKSAQSFDKKINTTLDKLREDSTLQQLNQHLQEANKFLDSIGNLYSSQCELEIKAVRQYYFLMTQAIEVLVSEIDEFLSKNASKECIQQRRSHIKEHSLDSLDEELIPYQMKACRFQVDAVNNWMFGLWEAIRHYIDTCRQELSRQADEWIEDIIVKLKKRQEVRLATHKPRYLEIKATIYDVRLKELQDHLEEANILEENIKRLIGDSCSVNQLCRDKRFSIIDNYEKTMRSIETSLQKATKSQHVASSLLQTKEATKTVKELLDNNFKENYDLINKNRTQMEIMVCHFSSSIRLFVDGGTYSRDEAKLFAKRIQKLQKALPKRCKKFFDEYNSVKADTMKKFQTAESAIIARLEQSKQEFDHNEKVCSMIHNLRLAIRNVAYKVKFEVHRLEASIEYFSNMSKFEVWKRKKFTVMKETVDECLEKIKDLTDVLTGGYIKTVKMLIEESYNNIEDVTKSFYATRGFIINKGKIHDSCDEFLEEVEKSCGGFRVQVEIHGLECLQDLLKLVVRLLSVNNEVYEELLGRFPGFVGVIDNEEQEMKNRLSQESFHLDERKKSLEEVKEVDSGVAKIVGKNEEREKFLRSVILELWECINEKINAMEQAVDNMGDNEELGRQ